MDEKQVVTEERTPATTSVAATSRATIGMVTAVAAFFLAQFLWMFSFAKLGLMPSEEKEASTQFMALLFGGIAFGLGLGYFVGNLVEGQPAAAVVERIFAPFRTVLSWILLGCALAVVLIIGYLVLRSVAALPVSIAILLGALIIASAIRGRVD